MDERQAVAAFGSLAQETRLRIVRMLVKPGGAGLSAGAIAEELRVQPSNTSFHLAHLERAGLIESRREARSIIYSAAYPALGNLIRFLMDDCCAGDQRVLATCLPVAAVGCSPKARRQNG
jgi:DNA-binding transcriptional ArsR family regulator